MPIINIFALLVSAIILTGASAKPSLEQRLLNAEDHRLATDPAFEQAFQSGNPKIRTQALRALGRIGDPKSLSQIGVRLKDQHISVRSMAAFALGLIDADDSRKFLRQRLNEKAGVRLQAEIATALGRVGGSEDIETLREFLKSPSSHLLRRAAIAVGNLYAYRLQSSPDAGMTLLLAKHLESRVVSVSNAAAFALGRVKELPKETHETVIKAFLKLRKGETLGLAARILAKIPGDDARDALLKRSSRRSTHVRVETIRALAKHEVNDVVWRRLIKAMRDRQAQVRVQTQATLRALKGHPDFVRKALTVAIAKERSAWVRSEHIKTLAFIDVNAFHQSYEKHLSDKAEIVVQATISALPSLFAKDKEKISSLLEKFTSSPSTRIAGAAIDALTRLETSDLPQEAVSAVIKSLERNDEALSYYASTFATKHKLKSMVPALTGALKTADVESSIALLDAIGELGEKKDAKNLRPFLKSPTKQVAVAAARAIEKLTGEKLQHLVPINSTITEATPSLREIRQALKTRLVFITKKGRFVMGMYPDAPLTATKIVRLARKGFYDGLTFHRVVANFVVQGGDPRGDGFGGPGYTIREEISMRSHRRGIVGMATAGKDTGGSQFFINHAPNLHLDGRYTVFGHIARGLSVIDRLEQDDVIERVVVGGW